MLAAMFSGRWEGSHKHDRKGRIFLNYNPYCFEKLLCYLRSRAIGRPDHATPAPCIDADHQADFGALLDHLGLTQYVSSAKMKALCFTTSRDVKLSADRRTAEVHYNRGNNGRCQHYDFGGRASDPIEESISFVKCKILSAMGILLGIAQHKNGSEVEVFQEMTDNIMFSGYPHRTGGCKWKTGDDVVFKIDLVNKRVSMWSSKPAQSEPDSADIKYLVSSPVVFECRFSRPSSPSSTGIGKVQLLDVFPEDMVHFR